MTEARPCPRCDTPIPDTAYVCTRCADVLAVALRNAAANWVELEAATARQTALAGVGSSPNQDRTMRGPTDIPCFHDSCLRVRQSQLRAMWTESPIPGETNHVSFGSMESAWDVTNTATTWARLIEEESGRPIPPPSPTQPIKGEPRRIVIPRRPEPPKPKRRNVALCDYSWLPVNVCACGHPHAKEPA